MRATLQGFALRIREALGRSKDTRQVVCDASGFTVVDRDKTVSRIRWSDVLEIFACKDDLGHYDTIWIGIRTRDEGTLCLVSEDFIGFKELVAELERRFPGIRTDWFAEVAFPAFAPNITVLWYRR